MDILIQKKTISEELGISLATVNNWIKTRVIPSPDIQNCYSQRTYKHIISTVKNNQARLNSRANRKFLDKKSVCSPETNDKDRKKLLADLVNDFENSGLSVTDGVLALSFALLRSNKLIDKNWKANRDSKLDAVLSEWAGNSPSPHKAINFFIQYEIPYLNDDILGAFYQSVQSISKKSNSGLFYTPSKLINEITVPPDKTVLDPCCGSGKILLNIITKSHNPSCIFARDTDETALNICFINLALFFNSKNITPNISKQDITVDNSGVFSGENSEKFDYIATNPPWGSKFSGRQKERLIALYPELATSEIFSIALYNALKELKDGGKLYFFLPHSFLNVGIHRKIRHYIFNEKRKVSVKLLGNAFKGVLSESILLCITNGSPGRNVSIQDKDGNRYKLPLKDITPPDYIVSVAGKTLDTAIIDRIYNTKHKTLNEDALFALGIVTGNNKKYLTKEKTIKTEAVFRGRDIGKYTFYEPVYYLEFDPGLYQQTAPEEYYRQKKIVYRFIGGRLVCALDKKGLLLLNSANLFIPKNYPMETIAAFFNSDIYTFIFRKKFHSRKVLKTHLQNLPLPVLPCETHRFIYRLYKKTFSRKNKDISAFQDTVDRIICDAFSISTKQFNYIKSETKPSAGRQDGAIPAPGPGNCAKG